MDVTRRLDDKNLISNDDLDHSLWLEDIEEQEDKHNDKETERNDRIEPRDVDVPELDDIDNYITQDEPFSQDTTDPYIGEDINMTVDGKENRATIKIRKKDDDGNLVRLRNNKSQIRYKTL